MGLGQFVLHKAFHRKMQSTNTVGSWDYFEEEFHDWLAGSHCQGEGDPRCLPFHLFRRRIPFDDLTTGEGQTRFTQRYGSQSSRLDDNGLCWNRPQRALHGRDILQVAGRELAMGFHWDVVAGSRGSTITTTSDVWQIKSNGYINIYPDAHVRSGGTASRKRPRK